MCDTYFYLFCFIICFIRFYQNDTSFNIFLDLPKPFDTIDHQTLLNKLKQKGLKLLESYLTNRTQFVEFTGVLSNTIHISTGVPQGSILSSLLF